MNHELAQRIAAALGSKCVPREDGDYRADDGVVYHLAEGARLAPPRPLTDAEIVAGLAEHPELLAEYQGVVRA